MSTRGSDTGRKRHTIPNNCRRVAAALLYMPHRNSMYGGLFYKVGGNLRKVAICRNVIHRTEVESGWRVGCVRM
jgi:hypothetical protein